MKKLFAIALALGLIAAPAPAPAKSASSVKLVSGKGLSRVWVGRNTSAAMGKATRNKVVSVAYKTGETPMRVKVKSPVTQKTYTMRYTKHVTRGGQPVAVWTAKGKSNTTLRVEFWIP